MMSPSLQGVLSFARWPPRPSPGDGVTKMANVTNAEGEIPLTHGNRDKIRAPSLAIDLAWVLAERGSCIRDPGNRPNAAADPRALAGRVAYMVGVPVCRTHTLPSDTRGMEWPC